MAANHFHVFATSISGEYVQRTKRHRETGQYNSNPAGDEVNAALLEDRISHNEHGNEVC
jgi:hypothetical protein